MESGMNEYEKAFVDHVEELGIGSEAFPALVREALEAEYGGEIDAVFKELSQETLESPEKFATEVFRVFGTSAMQYYVSILKYAESGNFHPQEDQELQKEEDELKSIVEDVGSDAGNTSPD
jgi:hypothetical protein